MKGCTVLTQKEILDYLIENKVFYKEKLNIEKIGIFGSFARDEQTDLSDIDLIIELKDNTKDIYELKQKLKNSISDKFNRNVDVCRIKYIKPFLKKYILDETIYA